MARLFSIIGRDGPNGPTGRKLHREKHLMNLESLEQRGQLVYAGPLLDGDGQPTGSLILLEAEDLEDARRFVESDPYVTEGIFASYEVIETRATFGPRAATAKP